MCPDKAQVRPSLILSNLRVGKQVGTRNREDGCGRLALHHWRLNAFEHGYRRAGGESFVARPPLGRYLHSRHFQAIRVSKARKIKRTSMG